MPTVAQLAVAIAVKLLVLALIVGVLRNGLHRQCWSFLAYLLMIFTYGTLELTGILFYGWPGLEWPRLLWNRDFWHFKQTAYEVIKLCVALELGARVVAAFPGTWRTARALLVLTLLTTTAVVGLGDTPDQHPLVGTATIWLFASASLVVTFFRLPIRSWYRALLLGFVSYLFVFTTLTGLLARRGLPAAKVLGSIDQVAYFVLVGWWTYSAWRGEERLEGIEPEILRRLGLQAA
jgi:hypothetical protein